MTEICVTPAAKAAESVQQAKPAAKPAEAAPPQPKRDRVEVSDEAKARLAAEEQAKSSSQEQAVVRTQGEKTARADASVEALGLA